MHILCTYVLLSCVYIYLRSASEESHKETQEHSAHFTCGVHGRGRSFNSTAIKNSLRGVATSENCTA